jgi:hypothetical protein
MTGLAAGRRFHSSRRIRHMPKVQVSTARKPEITLEKRVERMKRI